MKYKEFIYTKDNGETSERKVLIVVEARKTHLCYDVTNLNSDDIDWLKNISEEMQKIREEMLQEFEESTDIKLDKLWRSFKPEGISYNES